MLATANDSLSGEGFNQTALRCIAVARAEALRLGLPRVTTICMLVGLVCVTTSVASIALGRSGLNPEIWQSPVASMDSLVLKCATTHAPLLDERVFRAAEVAREAALWFGDPAVGSEHLLIGLLAAQKGSGAEPLLQLLPKGIDSVPVVLEHVRAVRLEFNLAGTREP